MIYLRNQFVFIILIFAAVHAIAGGAKEELVTFHNISYRVYTIPVNPVNSAHISLVQNTAGLKNAEFVARYTNDHDSDFFAINACISSSSYEPAGLFISGGQTISPVNSNDGKGNFYLKPNGLFITTDSDMIVCRTSELSNFTPVVNAVQSGPMLVFDNKIHPDFHQNSTNKNVRCGVGTYVKGGVKYCVFCISEKPVNFYEFAFFLKTISSVRMRCAWKAPGV